MAGTSGITALRKIQLGLETVSGTNVTPDVLWRGTGSVEDMRKIVNVGENIGYHAPIDTTYIAQTGGQWTLEQDVNAEQLLHVLNAGYNLGGPGSDGAGSGKIWTATMPHAASTFVPTGTYTLRQIMTQGAVEWADEGAFGYVSEYSLTGTPGELLKLSSTWMTRGVAAQSGAASIAVPTVHPIPFGGGTMYLDNASGTIGSTAKSNSLIGFGLSVKTGLVPAYTVDRLDFSVVKYTRPEVVAKITWEQNASANTERQTVHWGQTTRQLRLKFVGVALTTPGTTYTYYTLIIDIVGKWTKFDPVDSQDGDEIVTGTFTGMYNATADLYHRVILVNEEAAVP
jgi:hypothetical protein